MTDLERAVLAIVHFDACQVCQDRHAKRVEVERLRQIGGQ